jgi:pimeloyl-ACP methyl ester carboxylesterase
MHENREFRGFDKIVIRGEAWGSRDNSPVILLHGGGQTRHSWAGACKVIANDGWYALAVDLRGHGESDWSADGEYGLERFSADLRAIIGTLDVKPVVVGASLGGMVALLTEGNAETSLMSGIVLVDIAPRTESKGVDRIVSFMTGKPEGFATLEEVADAISVYNPHRKRPKDLSGLARNLRSVDGRWYWHWDPRFMQFGDTESRPPRDPEVLEAAARNLQIPTLLVRGKQSDLLSEEGAQQFLEQVPHAKYVDVSGAGHMVAGDKNDAFSNAVIDFLRPEIRGVS